MSKNCFIFPGQGAQKIGMGKSLYDQYDEVKNLFNLVEEVIQRPITKICFEGPIEELNKTHNSQIALLLCGLASYEVLKKMKPDIEVELFGGLSLGEYTAQAAANVIDYKTVFTIVQKRAELMQKACEENSGGMASIIGLSNEDVQNLCNETKGYMSIANLNCPGQIVVSGEKEYIDDICDRAKSKGAKLCIPLSVSGAFHSKLMESASQKFMDFIKGFSINQNALTKVLSNVKGTCYTMEDSWADLMAKQIVSPVLWENNLRVALSIGVEKFYELGPGKTLSGMLKRIDRKVTCYNLENYEQFTII